MSRNPSVDWVTIEQEYVYSSDMPSLTALAEKHQIARSGLAAKAQHGKWFERREEFRAQLGKKTLEALADKWAAYETANREKRMETANAALDAFITDLRDGKVKIASKDAIEWIRLMRDEFDDVRNLGKPAEVIDGQAYEMSEDEARAAVEYAERMLTEGTHGAAEPDAAT